MVTDIYCPRRIQVQDYSQYYRNDAVGSPAPKRAEERLDETAGNLKTTQERLDETTGALNWRNLTIAILIAVYLVGPTWREPTLFIGIFLILNPLSIRSWGPQLEDLPKGFLGTLVISSIGILYCFLWTLLLVRILISPAITSFFSDLPPTDIAWFAGFSEAFFIFLITGLSFMLLYRWEQQEWGRRGTLDGRKQDGKKEDKPGRDEEREERTTTRWEYRESLPMAKLIGALIGLTIIWILI
jgi:hypothetical protein